MNTLILWVCESEKFLVTRALALNSAKPRALLMPSGVPSGARSCRLPSPLGLEPLICVYGRAVAAVSDGDRSKPNGSVKTPTAQSRSNGPEQTECVAFARQDSKNWMSGEAEA